MLSDFKGNSINIVNKSVEDYKDLINSLCNDKLKLLKEKKVLYNLIAEKDEQILKMSENYQKKWESVSQYLKSVEELFNELNVTSNHRFEELKEDNRIIFNSPMDSSFSNSSFFTVTDTTTAEDSNFTTSSESLVAATNETIRKSLKPKETYYSLNSLSNFKEEFGRPRSSDDDDDDVSYPGYCTINRPHSQHNNSTSNNKSSDIPCLDSAVSEPQFAIPDVPSPKPKRLRKKSSTIKSDQPIVRTEKLQNQDKNFDEYTDKDVLNWLINVVRLPKLLIEDLKLKNKLDGIYLDQMTEQKLCKLFGTSDKLIRKKIMLGLEEVRCIHNRENISDSDLSLKDDKWVANTWLKKHLGLGHLSHAFLSRSVDGRLLKFIASSPHARQKELISMAATNFDHLSGISIIPINFSNNKNTTEPSKSDLRSIKYGLELFTKFNFDLGELERRRSACENNNLDVLVWTNERVAKWFNKINMKNYIRGIEYSGIHGGIMVLDPQFTMATMSKLLQIPIEVVKKNNLDDKFSALLKPSRFNEGVKNRRSTSIFRRRSFSQPRRSKPSVNHDLNYKISTPNPEISDSASNNDNETQTLKAIFKEKSQTIDLSSSTNQNFIRKYRKPSEDIQHRQKSDSVLPDSSSNLNVPNQLLKCPSNKISTQSAQISRKMKTNVSNSISGSENSEEL